MTSGIAGHLRRFYWKVSRSISIVGHMLSVPWFFVKTTIRLIPVSRISSGRRPTVAIALIDAMGDIVAAEPIARLARERHPDAWICWFTQTAYISLPASFPEVDHVVGVTCLTEWMLLRRLRLFDVVWDLHHDGRACGHCGIPQTKPGVLTNAHNYLERGNLLDMECESAGLPRLTEGPRLLPPLSAITAVDALALPPRFIVIHGVSRETRKDWPTNKWRDLIRRIHDRFGLSILEVGVKPLVILEDGVRERSLCGALGLLETAEVIRRAVLFIGIDSGPAHLANAVATQGVILLGTYANFRTYMPYSGGFAAEEMANIVRNDGPVADISVAAVFDAVEARMFASEDMLPLV
jgi:heptosyltransferase-3